MLKEKYSKSKKHLINFLSHISGRNLDLMTDVPFDKRIVSFVKEHIDTHLIVNLKYVMNLNIHILPILESSKDFETVELKTNIEKHLVESAKIKTYNIKGENGDSKVILLCYWPRELAETANITERLSCSMALYLRNSDEIIQSAELFHKHFNYDVIHDAYLIGSKTKIVKLLDGAFGEEGNPSRWENKVSNPIKSRHVYVKDKEEAVILDKEEFPDTRTSLLFKIPAQDIRYRKNGGFEKIRLNDYFISWNSNNAFLIYEITRNYNNELIMVPAVHPHIQNGSYCAGGWSQEWLNNSRKGRAYAVAAGFAQFLRRYNSGSPYNAAHKFRLDYSKNYEEHKIEEIGSSLKSINTSVSTLKYTFNDTREAIDFRKFGNDREELMKACIESNVEINKAMFYYTLISNIQLLKRKQITRKFTIALGEWFVDKIPNTIGAIPITVSNEKGEIKTIGYRVSHIKAMTIFMEMISKAFSNFRQNNLTPAGLGIYENKAVENLKEMLKEYYPKVHFRVERLVSELIRAGKILKGDEVKIEDVIKLCKTRRSDISITKSLLSNNTSLIKESKLKSLSKETVKCFKIIDLYMRRSLLKNAKKSIKIERKVINEINNIRFNDVKSQIFAAEVPC